MNESEANSDSIDIVMLLLKGKNDNVLTLIQNLLDKVIKSRGEKSDEIQSLVFKSEQIRQKIESSNIPYEKAVASKKRQFEDVFKKIDKNIETNEEKIEETQDQLELQDEEDQIARVQRSLDKLNHVHKQLENHILDMRKKEETVFQEIKKQRDDFVNKLQNDEHVSMKRLKQLKAENEIKYFEQIKLDNLHHAITKNPNTLFNDGVKHDLTLFAHKDSDFKIKLNHFFNETLKSKSYQHVINKIGKIIGDIYTTSKGINVLDLIAIYSKLFDYIDENGPDQLSRPIAEIFLSPEVQEMLGRINKDLSLPELLQLAKLDKDIHENIFVHSICIDFYISLLRAEVKEAANKNEVFKMPEVKWDGLMFMTTQWPLFFRKFGESLKAFEELQYIRLFKESMDTASEVVKNPISHKILKIILDYRKKRRGTFKMEMATEDYISLFYDTVSMSNSNSIRSPHFKEVLELQRDLNGVTRLSFLNLFSAIDVNRMQTHEDEKSEDDKEHIFLKFNEINLDNEVLLKTLKIKDFTDIPIALQEFLRSLSVDVDDHYLHMQKILEKEKEFIKNIQLSIVSSDNQLPLVNELYKSVLKCCEYVNAPKALEELIISTELEKALNRRANANETSAKN
ncbi:MAG: hypothetical protein COA79_02820 [Planctomycetota bacterium]|nr:MAG: hypothetical protein COA79_02820 [Planctomycetota bacterium]